MLFAHADVIFKDWFDLRWLIHFAILNRLKRDDSFRIHEWFEWDNSFIDNKWFFLHWFIQLVWAIKT